MSWVPFTLKANDPVSVFMAITNYNAQRDFMRRMIRSYEQDLLQLINETPDHPGGDWAKDDLKQLEYLRLKTFSDNTQTITF
jgi:hypothetical protein